MSSCAVDWKSVAALLIRGDKIINLSFHDHLHPRRKRLIIFNIVTNKISKINNGIGLFYIVCEINFLLFQDFTKLCDN